MHLQWLSVERGTNPFTTFSSSLRGISWNFNSIGHPIYTCVILNHFIKFSYILLVWVLSKDRDQMGGAKAGCKWTGLDRQTIVLTHVLKYCTLLNDCLLILQTKYIYVLLPSRVHLCSLSCMCVDWSPLLTALNAKNWTSWMVLVELDQRRN